MSDTSTKKQRVIAYIDGFNLYFGLRDICMKQYYWLDVYALVSSFIRPEQELVMVKYFTAQITTPGATRDRQRKYLNALSTIKNLEIIEGKYQAKSVNCSVCYKDFMTPEEKMTDVNIAVNLLMDAVQDRYDVAVLISGDSDLVPPVKAVRSHFPGKGVVVAFPPNRVSKELSEATGSFKIFTHLIKRNQLPDRIEVAPHVFVNNPWTKDEILARNPNYVFRKF